jgi:5-methylcytosine-specific restriction protein A
MSRSDFEALKASLRPFADLKVMDLVEETGIDVQPWAVKEGGAPVANPRANPNYCYEWAFVEEGEPIALCVWHETLVSHSMGIAFTGNLRARATRLEEIVLDRRESAKTRSRAKQQAKRCDAFDWRVQRAVRKSLPVRVILLEGERADQLGHDSSKVRLRRLDEVQWWVHDYDEAAGRFDLVRGVPPSRHEPGDGRAAGKIESMYVDQFSAPAIPERKERRTSVFARSADVRRRVLIRAAGCCEYCGRHGFKTASGQIYLETHHVEPLSDGGADCISNLVALCPDDHRKAHFSADAAAIKSSLGMFLAGIASIDSDVDQS